MNGDASDRSEDRDADLYRVPVGDVGPDVLERRADATVDRFDGSPTAALSGVRDSGSPTYRARPCGDGRRCPDRREDL